MTTYASTSPECMMPASVSMSAPTASASARLPFIDNIRWTMIVLVLSMHAADTYSPFGNWYYTEHPPLAPLSILFFGTWQTFLQAFFMGLLFFIAGYFTPPAYDRKGGRQFLRDRSVRLGVPTLLYMLAIGPLMEYYVSHSWHTTDSFAQAWWNYIRDGQVISGTGPLWFCAALLIFCCVYAGVRALRPQPPARASSAIGYRAFVLAVAILTLASFAVRIVIPSGTSFENFSLADFPQYILLYAGGILVYRRDWLARLDGRLAMRVCAVSLAIAIALWLALIGFGGALHGRMRPYDGGLTWQSASLCLWNALVCVGMGSGLIALFRRRYDAQGGFARFMSANAFAVYVFHPPILIALALVLRPLALPAVLKFAALTLASAGASFLACVWVVRRIPLLRRAV